jgi:hypothetical protein
VLESLENRQLLSTFSIARPSQDVVPGVVQAQVRALPAILLPIVMPGHGLAGTGHGNYAVPRLQLLDVGTTYNLQGVADLAALGHVTVTCSVHSVGFIWHGHATGKLTFTNASGSVTVALEGPVQNDFAPLPGRFHYQVVSATGAYRHMRDQGSLQLVLAQAPTDVVHRGTFTFTIDQGILLRGSLVQGQ